MRTTPMTTRLTSPLTGFDLTPLFRSSVGFDSLSRLVDSALKLDEASPSYPPYNIEKRGEDAYRITMAVAGFAESDLTITAQENTLLVQGKQSRDADKAEVENFLHRGIAARAFERRFQLADHIRVTGAKLENGLLHVELVREVPEAAKPRMIAIDGGSKAPTIDSKSVN